MKALELIASGGMTSLIPDSSQAEIFGSTGSRYFRRYIFVFFAPLSAASSGAAAAPSSEAAASPVSGTSQRRRYFRVVATPDSVPVTMILSGSVGSVPMSARPSQTGLAVELTRLINTLLIWFLGE